MGKHGGTAAEATVGPAPAPPPVGESRELADARARLQALPTGPGTKNARARLRKKIRKLEAAEPEAVELAPAGPAAAAAGWAPGTHPPGQGPIVIEVGGTKPGCAASLLAPRAGVTLSAHGLPNPHGAIQRGRLPERLTDITAFLTAKAPGAFAALVAQGVSAVEAEASGRCPGGSGIRVECFGGRHRSQAVARGIVAALAPDVAARVRVHCLDAPPTRE